MSAKQDHRTTAAMTADVKRRSELLALHEKRSLTQQYGVLIERGLNSWEAEYGPIPEAPEAHQESPTESPTDSPTTDHAEHRASA